MLIAHTLHTLYRFQHNLAQSWNNEWVDWKQNSTKHRSKSKLNPPQTKLNKTPNQAITTKLILDEMSVFIIILKKLFWALSKPELSLFYFIVTRNLIKGLFDWKWMYQLSESV